MTYRERRQRRVARLRDWAAKREARAAATFAAHEQYRGDHAFNFQSGHIPERARVVAREDRAFESLRKAQSMQSRADTIEAAAAAAIYSDDPDAIEQLRAHIASLAAERDRIKAYNLSCRRDEPDEGLLDEAQRASLDSVRKYAPFQLGKNGACPSYALSNLNGNLARQRQRLAQLVAEARLT